MDLTVNELDQLLFNSEACAANEIPSEIDAKDNLFLDAAISDLLNTDQFLEPIIMPVKEEYLNNSFAVGPVPASSGSSSEAASQGPKCDSSPTSSTAGPEGICVGGDTIGQQVANSKKRSAEAALGEDCEDAQREKRLQRNRESAALSRWRKKTTMQSLMVKNAELEKLNSKLNYLLSCANMDNQALRTELVRYQSACPVAPATVLGESAELTLVERTKYASPANSLPLEDQEQSSVHKQHQLCNPQFTQFSDLKHSLSYKKTQKRFALPRLHFLFLACLALLAPLRLVETLDCGGASLMHHVARGFFSCIDTMSTSKRYDGWLPWRPRARNRRF